MEFATFSHRHKDADISPEETVRQYLGAYESGDRAMLEAVIAQEFVFTSPQDDHIDRDAYFEKCWPMAGTFKAIAIERVFAQEEEAFVKYTITNKDGKPVRNAEFIIFRGPRIARIDVFFGRWG